MRVRPVVRKKFAERPAQRAPRAAAACELLEPQRLLSVELLSDVNPNTPGGIPHDLRLSQPVISGGLAYFVADDGHHGCGAATAPPPARSC